LSIVRQQALTLVAAIVPGREAELDTWLRTNKRALQRALERSTTTHFARWVILPPSQDEDGKALGEGPLLAFESNFDGQLEQHLADLRAALGSLLDGAFAHVAGYPGSADVRQLEQFFRRGALRAAAFYVAHGGLPVGVIRGDAALKQAVEQRLSARSQGARVRAEDALELAEDLQRVARALATERGLTLGHVERGLRPSSSSITMAALRAALSHPLGVLLAFLLAPFFEWRDARVRRRRPSFRSAVLQQKRDGIGLEEDRVDQNGLTHLVPIKPGRYRAFALKMMVLIVTGLADFGARVGRLGGIETIHFARWVVLPDRRLLFFSNYDGSWEAYLGDFIDKASMGLTMIWTNTQWYPKTRLLLFKGARDEGAFKEWTRAYQVPTQVWYSAYPFSSVTDVLKNARIRELLGSVLDRSRSEELLALL
jgi:hypothetical protein